MECFKYVEISQGCIIPAQKGGNINYFLPLASQYILLPQDEKPVSRPYKTTYIVTACHNQRGSVPVTYL
jgi:hypothetical protein